MKSILCLIIFLFLTAILFSQQKNFEGLIKYELQNPNTLKSDTIIYYFGKNKIRVKRTGDLAKKYGAISDIFYDFKNETNRSELWSEQRKELTSIEHENGNVVFQQIDSIITKEIANQKCVKSIVELKPTEFSGNIVDKTDYLFISDNLHYKLPKNWDFYDAIFSNGTGRIVLEMETIIVTNFLHKVEKKTPSTLRAFEIIKRKIKKEELLLEPTE